MEAQRPRSLAFFLRDLLGAWTSLSRRAALTVCMHFKKKSQFTVCQAPCYLYSFYILRLKKRSQSQRSLKPICGILSTDNAPWRLFYDLSTGLAEGKHMVETALGDRIWPPDWPRETDGSSRKRETAPRVGSLINPWGWLGFLCRSHTFQTLNSFATVVNSPKTFNTSWNRLSAWFITRTNTRNSIWCWRVWTS